MGCTLHDTAHAMTFALVLVPIAELRGLNDVAPTNSIQIDLSSNLKEVRCGNREWHARLVGTEMQDLQSRYPVQELES